MAILKKINTFVSFKLLGRKRTRKLIEKLCNSVSLNLLDIAHQEIGIASYGYYSEKSELYIIEDFLKQYFAPIEENEPVFFDVGANIGNYTESLTNQFPNAVIHSFEPNPVSYEKLNYRFLNRPNIIKNLAGLGSETSEMSLYSYKNNEDSEHASVYKSVMEDLHQSKEVIDFNVNILTLDNYCLENNISQIDFIKIDTEGYELEVLKGGTKMIMENKIKFIQFEFNEMNIYSRVFLKDFYALLENYTFYRLMDNKLLPLGKYNSKNEIFRYQNILAVNNN